MAQPEEGDVYQIEIIDHPILDQMIAKFRGSLFFLKRHGSTVRFRDPKTGKTLSIVILPTEGKG